MPPIPSKLTEDAKEVIESLERRARFVKEDTIPRLHACGSPSPPTLGSANGNIDPVKEQQRLSEEVRDELGVLARDIEASLHWTWYSFIQALTPIYVLFAESFDDGRRPEW